MIAVLAAIFCGLVVGAIFAFFTLPVPAPPSWAGVAGVAGITIGWRLVEWLR